MFASVSATAGSRVHAYHPAEMADLAGRVLVGTLRGPGGSLPLVPAAAVMVLGLAGRRVVRRRRPAVIAA